MYAYSYVNFPASELYNQELIETHRELIGKCHIYFVGYVPVVKLVDAVQRGDFLVTMFTVAGEPRDLEWQLPPAARFARDGEGFWVELESGERSFPTVEASILRLHADKPMLFDVQYIGQAFGKNGERNAYDRLIRHETLQRIALNGAPDGYRLEIILVELHPSNRVFQVINPWADERDEDGSRIANSLDTLFGTTTAQQVSLYEAALIRYFQPKYNKEFKNSFPSTNLKILDECYDKDMAAVIAEFCFEEIHFLLKSDAVPPRPYHIASYNIHGSDDRDIFFGRKVGNLRSL